MTTFSQAQYEALRDAVAQGVLEIEFEGKKVKYRSQAQMLALMDRMERELGHSSRKSVTYPVHRKGL